jgi:aminocarboxymuconate-semialdehyde decarboxylase
VRVIDVHSHQIPASCIDHAATTYESYTVHILGPHGGEPLHTERRIANGHDPEQLYSVSRRLNDMQAQGIDLHVLSVPPFCMYYELDPARALGICRRINDSFAETVAFDRGHFAALATLPMQDPPAAARELERAIRELGLNGVEIGTNIDGKNLDDRSLAPFFAKVAELDVPIFVHSVNTLGADRLDKYHLGNLIGNPTDDALAAASLIFGGVLEEFPSLKVFIAHGGGSCPFLRGRWEHGWHVRPEGKTHIKRPPSEYFSKLRFDTLTHYGPALNYLAETIGPERLMLGTDYPFDMSDTDQVKAIASLPHLSDAQKEMIYGGNAIELLKLEV